MFEFFQPQFDRRAAGMFLLARGLSSAAMAGLLYGIQVAAGPGDEAEEEVLEEEVLVEFAPPPAAEAAPAPRPRALSPDGRWRVRSRRSAVELEEVANLAPSDSTMFAYMRAPIGTLLRLVEDSLEPAAQANLNDTLKRVNGLSGGTASLINVLDGALVDRVAFFVRPNDWEDRSIDFEVAPDTGEKRYIGPPRDDRPVFGWALVAWASDQGAIDDLQAAFGQAGPRIGIQGKNPGDKGYFVTTIEGGLRLQEFWSQLIPGTGHIAMLSYGDKVILSNRYQFVEDVTKNAVGRSRPGDRLGELASFQRALTDGLESANIALWLSPETGSDLIRTQSRDVASARLADVVSAKFATARPKAERRVCLCAHCVTPTAPISTAFKWDGDQIVLVPAEPVTLPPVGAQLGQRLDWERRFRHMRVHTALHLLSVAIPLGVTGGQISAAHGRLDFDMPEAPHDRDEIEAQLNRFVEEDLVVTESWITQREHEAAPNLVKTMSVKPPKGTGDVRLIRIGPPEHPIDLQPCGGTHVARTGEIGTLRRGKIQKKGRMNRRVYLHLDT